LKYVFYVPEAYLTHFSYRCRFLNCSVERVRERWLARQNEFNLS
jgi:hypothetical protein